MTSGEIRVAALGFAPVKGSRWQWRESLTVDLDGVRDDRRWALVDEELRCLRTVRHPELVSWCAPTADELAEAAARAHATRCQVSYWGRPITADVFDLRWCAEASELTGRRVRLARAVDARFIWEQPVSVVFASELEGLPGGSGDSAGARGVVPMATHRADGPLQSPGQRGDEDVLHGDVLHGEDVPHLVDDLARYRPNLVLDDLTSPARPAPGVVLTVGNARLVLQEQLTRCTVINHRPAPLSNPASAQPTPGEPRAGDALFQSLASPQLGWGCSVLVASDVSCGTPATLS